MSHYAVANIKIENPNMELLKEALSKIAEKLNGRVVEDFMVKGWGFTKYVPIGVKVPLPYGNGYGIEITRSGIKVHVDDHGAPLTAREFAEKLIKEYTTLAIARTLQEEGYEVNVEEGEQNVIYATEVGI